jgi:hypothetical protein
VTQEHHNSDLVVVWPLHRWHYLNVPDPEIVNMTAVDESLSLPIVVTPGRALAARALLAGPDCSQQRVSHLLGVSRRTIGRMAAADLSTALRDPQLLEIARTCLAETASRGSTAEERGRGGRLARGGRPVRTPGRAEAAGRDAAKCGEVDAAPARASASPHVRASQRGRDSHGGEPGSARARLAHPT